MPREPIYAESEFKLITQSELIRLLDYNPNTGQFRWKVNHSTRAKQNGLAGRKHNKGYWTIRINNKDYLAHRLAWLWMTGSWPINTIDHINGIRNDNRLCNLREATHAEQKQNVVKRKNNKSQYTGVSFCKKRQLWRSDIWLNYKQIFLGYFDTAEQAAEAYKAAKEKYHTFNPKERT
jgi:hypothetical protein